MSKRLNEILIFTNRFVSHLKKSYRIYMLKYILKKKKFENRGNDDDKLSVVKLGKNTPVRASHVHKRVIYMLHHCSVLTNKKIYVFVIIIKNL